jgi:hypothetical protein
MSKEKYFLNQQEARNTNSLFKLYRASIVHNDTLLKKAKKSKARKKNKLARASRKLNRRK